MVILCRWVKVAVALSLVLSPISFANDEASVLQQKMLKSAFVLNVAKFVSWPEFVYQERPEKLILCHFQTDSLGVGFEIIRNRSVDGRQLFKEVLVTLDEAQSCDILFVSDDYLVQFLDANMDRQMVGVLVIADRTDSYNRGRGFSGVHVSLIRDSVKIGFEVNLAEVSKSKLKLSSELLKLSTIVGGS